MATFWKGTRVSTPLGIGTVVYQRMAPPTFVEAMSVSVLLDSKKNNYNYSGTIFKAEDVKRYRSAREVANKLGAAEHDSNIPEPRFDEDKDS